jgi:hypothetical protein
LFHSIFDKETGAGREKQKKFTLKKEQPRMPLNNTESHWKQRIMFNQRTHMSYNFSGMQPAQRELKLLVESKVTTKIQMAALVPVQ